ncbi:MULTISPECIES: zinc-binding dehydrogenase [unclassified Streptomyces]|uniref:zinc-binding dehydrogenase n=1 Tax=unclassified Streptomyces TaxID=2593676 RepID=UPI001162C949|nr:MULTISPECIES: zinc-binding dehydrogenase [unclassified Streptomyces]NMI55826.1 zinc-binding dehydrogenase [Streptomyces sp. RLA2-12]QDN55301.1 zinc-binding dehydrogenase [Streptomyces sp. S1D4-20]QDN65480.1 zinc-binding dehydrogenase [Streptomyces sp. S1D4-14]QDN96119.1 zinc-binding dehydrogenase [Streptomyces sp. RLB1-9]QDO17824.1 zinc-binding dehydrogenase [Streptomyces sp. S1A1-8]
MNHRVVWTRSGAPADVLTVIEEPEPEAPAHGQVLIRTTAFPVHPGDLLRLDAFPATAAEPVPIGVEATGVVEAIGPDTRVAPGVVVGGRVTVFPLGGWAQWILADAGIVVPVPDELSDEVAAQMLTNPLTAVMLRREAEEHPSLGYDGYLVQAAAGSSVGRLVTGVMQYHNVGLVNVVRSDRGAAELRERFPDVPVVVTENPGWADEARKAADGRPISVAFDPVGGQLTESLLDLLAPGGRLVIYGELAEEPISVHASTLLHQALTVRGATLGRWLVEASAERRASDVVAATLIALEFKDRFDVAATYGLDELATAVTHAVRPGKVGTVLIRP